MFGCAVYREGVAENKERFFSFIAESQPGREERMEATSEPASEDTFFVTARNVQYLNRTTRK